MATTSPSPLSTEPGVATSNLHQEMRSAPQIPTARHPLRQREARSCHFGPGAALKPTNTFGIVGGFGATGNDVGTATLHSRNGEILIGGAQDLRTAGGSQFLQFLSSFDVSTFGGCPQKDFCLLAISGNPVSLQIKPRQVDFRGRVARNNRRPKTRCLVASIRRRIRRPAMRQTVRRFL